MHLYKNLKMADNAIGFTHASGNSGRSAYTSRVVDSAVRGRNREHRHPRNTGGKGLRPQLAPSLKSPDFPIRAYEFYDYHHELVNDTFVNYQDNATRKTGAISYLLFTSFGMSSNNTVEGAKFVNAKPAYFPPIENKWSNDDYGSSSFRSSVFHDLDGSVGGVPNSFIVINDGVAIDEACEVKPTWNAAVCKRRCRAREYWRGRWRWSREQFPELALRRAGLVVRAQLRVDLAVRAQPKAVLLLVPEAVSLGPAQPAITLSRNGKDFPYYAATNVRAGTEVKVTTERPNVNLSVSELDSGSWVIFELPGFTTAAAGAEQSSLDALRKASATSYYKGNGSLWVKLVSNG